MVEKHLMPTPPLSSNLVTQVWQKALPSVFVIRVSGAGRFGELQLHGWIPVCESSPWLCPGLQLAKNNSLLLEKYKLTFIAVLPTGVWGKYL